MMQDTSVAKMSGGDVDVEPYLDSRHTKGYGTATQILKTKGDQNRQSRQRLGGGVDRDIGTVLRKRWRYAEVYMAYGEHWNKNW